AVGLGSPGVPYAAPSGLFTIRETGNLTSGDGLVGAGTAAAALMIGGDVIGNVVYRGPDDPARFAFRLIRVRPNDFPVRVNASMTTDTSPGGGPPVVKSSSTAIVLSSDEIQRREIGFLGLKAFNAFQLKSTTGDPGHAAFDVFSVEF